MSNHHGAHWIRPEKRFAIYERDGFTCVRCGHRPDVFTLDHLFPRSSPWRDNHPRRLVTSCLSCNGSRQATRVSDTLRRIRSKGFDVAAVVRRLRIAREVPINRNAGRRALKAELDRARAPLPALDNALNCADGVQF